MHNILKVFWYIFPKRGYNFNKSQQFGKDMFIMKIYFSQKADTLQPVEEDFSTLSLQEAIEKTRRALDNAYTGFDNAVEADLIDSYIYEINSLQKRYKYLTDLAGREPVAETKRLYQHSPIRALVSHVFS